MRPLWTRVHIRVCHHFLCEKDTLALIKTPQSPSLCGVSSVLCVITQQNNLACQIHKALSIGIAQGLEDVFLQILNDGL